MSGALIAAASGGGAGVAVSFIDLSGLAVAVDPTDATVTYTINSNGTDVVTSKPTNTWLTRGLNSQVEIYATLTSGSLTTGTTGSWQVPTSNLVWTVTQTSIGAGEAVLSMQARRVSDQVALDSWTINFYAEVT